jgi:hypothetical protein
VSRFDLAVTKFSFPTFILWCQWPATLRLDFLVHTEDVEALGTVNLKIDISPAYDDESGKFLAPVEA